MKVHEIVQIGVGVPDCEAFARFASEVLGFSVTASADGTVRYVRTDQYHHRLAAESAPAASLRYVAFDAGPPDELASWETRLGREGIEFRRGTPEECKARQVAAFIELQDPDGHRVALSSGFATTDEPVRLGRGWNVLRLGHVLLTVADTQRSHDFYTSILGFRLSDWVYIDEKVRLCFLRCNERHHSLAFAPHMPGKNPRLQHVMFEVASLDDVMRAYHSFRACNAPIGMGPGRHPNCETVHVYVQTPGGFAVELGWGHRRVDDATHQPMIYPIGTPVDVWGGTVQAPEFELG
jgi:2,3-dihydroxybiphenyl 1,2-dioxygenase